MEAQQVLNEIIQEHDALCYIVVFDDDPEERDNAFLKALALRAVLQNMKNNLCKKPKDKEIFQKGLTDHYQAFSRKLFYNRQIVKE